MLSIKNLNSGYEELHVLRDVNLEFKNGEFISIVGPNGSGKTTILKSIFNIARVYQGSHILFFGKELAGLKTYELILQGISYVPQGRINFPELNIEQNLLLGNYNVKNKKLIQENLKSVYEFFHELHKYRHKLAFALSGGQQQMLAIGRALMLQPKLLLLDEPSLGLSPKLTQELFAKIKEISRKGTLVLMVEQQAKKAMEYSDKTVVMESGQVKLFGKSKTLLKDKRLGKVFLGGK
jgi:branched-chain amino acid transport system ATP-binding protein